MKLILKSVFVLLFIISSINLFSQEIFDSTIVKFQAITYFDSGQHELADSHMVELNTLIEKSKAFNGLLYFIDAHTDDVGAEVDNLELSRMRKETVHKYLLQNGIAKDIFSLRFHGEHKLAVNRKDPLSRQINRRVEIKAFTTDKYVNLRGQILDEETSEGLSGIVEIETSNFKSIVKTNDKGLYRLVAPLNELASITYHVKDYLFETKSIKITDSLSSLKTGLKKATIGNMIALKDVNFFGGSNVLLLDSRPNLEKLIKFMTISNHICIELAGHLNSSGIAWSPDVDVSRARSLIIYEELKNAGIKEERMIAKGYGDTYKLFPIPQSKVEARLNRRVEVVIVDCDSIAQIKNDSLREPKYYSNIVSNRKFNNENFKNEIKHFFNDQQLEILLQLREMKDKGEDPSNFTYAELLTRREDIKYKDNHTALTLKQIYKSDQFLRSQTKNIEQTYGLQSKEYKSHWKKISSTDSLNLIAVKEILKEKGWIGTEEASEQGNAAIFLVIQHSNSKTQLDYLPMMREAVKLGNAKSQDLALLEDRVALSQGEKQIYGSQIYRNAETGKRYVAPIVNPDKVNIKRKEVGLNPIEEYLLNWGIIWEKELRSMTTSE